MLVPSVVILAVFVLYPLVHAIQLGHLRCDATGTRCRDGGRIQYVDVFGRNEFRDAMFKTTPLVVFRCGHAARVR